MLQRWQLYVDESGDFGEPRSTVSVTGILIQPAASVPDEEVRRRLMDAVPGQPWPLHAAHLRNEIWYLLSRDSGHDLPSDEARALLGQHAPDLVRQVRDEVQSGELPRIRTLVALKVILERHAPALGRRISTRAFGAYRRLLSAVAEVLRDAPSMRVIIASEAWPDEPKPRGPFQRRRLEASRYDAVLEALLQRCADYLWRMSGAHGVSLLVSGRGTVDVRRGEFREMQVADVRRVVRRVAPRDARVEFDEISVARYDARSSAHQVLADLIACATRYPLGDRRGSLRAVATKINDSGRVAVMTVASGFPLLASDGAPLAYTRESGVAPSMVWPPSSSCRTWARDQAEIVRDVLHRRQYPAADTRHGAHAGSRGVGVPRVSE